MKKRVSMIWLMGTLWAWAGCGHAPPTDGTDTKTATSTSALLVYDNLYGVSLHVIADGVPSVTNYYREEAVDRCALWGFPVSVEDQNETSRTTSVRLHWADGTTTGWVAIADNLQPTTFLQHNDAGTISGHTFDLIKTNRGWRAWETVAVEGWAGTVEALYGVPANALAVITTNALKDPPSSLMGAYVAFKRQTQPTYVVTEDKTYLANGVVENQGWAEGVDLSQQPSFASSSERADAIRSWLKAHYSTLGVGYVLLIGDPNPSGGTLPMKNMYPYKHYQDVALVNPSMWLQAEVARNCLDYPLPPTYQQCTQWRDYHYPVADTLPTDYYYSNLTYDWPVDADGDITSITETDFGWQDVHVGRLPVYNDDVASMNKVLGKFIAYSTSTDTAWRRNALLAMNRHNANPPGEYVALGESTRDRILTPNGFGSYRIYDGPYQPAGCSDPSCYITGDLPLDSANINMGSVWAGNAWSGCQGAVCNGPKQNFGIVFWAAHGGPRNAANVIDLDIPAQDYSGSLDDLHPAFTVSVSCLNSMPYQSDNLGTTLLKKGAIAVLGATRYSWPGGGAWGANAYTTGSASSTDVGFGFVMELVDSKLPAGAALSAARSYLWEAVLAPMPIPDNTLDSGTWYEWNTLTWWKAQLLLFNLYGDPTIGLENETSSSVTTLPSDTPTNVTLAANQTVTFFADNWPSKGNPYWTANVVLSVNSLSGSPIPAGTVWVNGTAYPIGGLCWGSPCYYQVLDIPDQGPYTIELSTPAAATLQVQLGNR